MASQLTAAERLQRLQTSFPDGVKLARALSVAVRAEPELVREVRLLLLPRSGAELEADFYFSPFVAQRTGDWILLEPQLASEIQASLVDQIAADPEERERMTRVHHIVQRAHSSAPWEIACEEEVTWLSVSRPVGLYRTRAEIDRTLRGVLTRLLQGSDDSALISRWFASAARRMPALARETQAFALLAFACSSVLGGRRIDSGITIGLEIFDELARYLQLSPKRLVLWMGLTTRGLHIAFSAIPGYEPVEVPQTNPVLLDVRTEGIGRRLVQIPLGSPRFEPLPAGEVVVRTLARDLLTFRPRTARSAEPLPGDAGAASSARITNDIYVSYSHVDREWVTPFVENLKVRLEQLSGRPDIQIWMDAKLSGRDRLEEEIERNLFSSALLLAIVSPGYLSSESCSRELSTFLSGAAANGGITYGNASRVVPVFRMPVDREELPSVMQSVVGYEFYTRDPSTHRFREFEPSSAQLYARIDDLAQDVYRTLRTREQQLPAVYLGATPDMHVWRRRLSKELENWGFRVSSSVQTIVSSTACVFLVGESEGDLQRETLQEAVRQTEHRPEHRTYAWVPSNVANSASLDLHRIAAERNVEILSTGFEEFLEYLMQALRAPARVRKDSDRASRSIYIMCDLEDYKQLSPLMRRLGSSGHDIRIPRFEGEAANRFERQRRELNESDGVVIYWGKASEGWFRSSLLYAIRADHYPNRDTPLIIAAYLAPPGIPAKLDFEKTRAKGVITIHSETAPENGLDELVRVFGVNEAAS